MNMKKYLLQFVLLFCCQLVYSQNFSFKPAAGVNFCAQSITIAESQKPSEKKIHPGFDMGLNLEMKLKSNTSIEVGWFYSINRASLDRLFYSLVAGSADFPYTREDYTLNFIKAPINLLFRQKKDNPLFFGVGPVIKFNVGAQRDGKVLERIDSYSTKFKLATKNGRRTGVGLFLTTGRELKINKLKSLIRLNYDVDLTKWRYPTNFEYEEVHYFSFRNHNFSLLFSITL
jgi:hypothetical protein